jgi:hypothetical protein
MSYTSGVIATTIQALRSCVTVIALATGLTSVQAATGMAVTGTTGTVSLAPSDNLQIVSSVDSFGTSGLSFTSSVGTFADTTPVNTFDAYTFSLNDTSSLTYTLTSEPQTWFVGSNSFTLTSQGPDALPPQVVDLDPPFVRYPLVDDVVPTVPESSTWALMGLGLLFVLGARGRLGNARAGMRVIKR